MNPGSIYTPTAVAFWQRADAEANAAAETKRIGIKHEVIESTIHGTGRVIYNVRASVRAEVAA